MNYAMQIKSCFGEIYLENSYEYFMEMKLNIFSNHHISYFHFAIGIKFAFLYVWEMLLFRNMENHSKSNFRIENTIYFTDITTENTIYA